MAIKKIQISTLPKVGSIDDFIVLGVDRQVGDNAYADMTQLRGNVGAQGEKGDKGDRGDTGAQGIQGVKGDKGDRGEQGAPFLYDDFTAQQLAALKGEKGDKGDTGEQGIQGIQGEKGDRGEQGIQGIQGEQGEKGDQGDGLDYSTMTPEQIARITGKSAYDIAVENGFAGTQTEWIASLKGAKGDPGDAGEKGDTGPQGAQGEPGPQGPQGEPGETGADGESGADGASAYQQAVTGGYAGSEEEFCAILAKMSELAPVATSGSYNDLSDKPVGGTPIVSDVTQMFTTNSPASRFVARMTGHADNKKVIELFGDDTSGSSNDLIITAEIGFGSDREKALNIREYALFNSATPADYKAVITPETKEGLQSTITIPHGCPEFYIKYFVGIGTGLKKSYFVDHLGIYHNFNAENTPIGNFAQTGWDVVINGVIQSLYGVNEISFGEDYAGETLPTDFLRNFINVTSVDLSVFSRVTSLPGQFMDRWQALQSFDFSWAVAISQMTTPILYNARALQSIQIGSVDWSNVVVNPNQPTAGDPRNDHQSFQNTPNVSTSTIYADSQYLGEAFKAKFTNLSNWSIVVNP